MVTKCLLILLAIFLSCVYVSGFPKKVIIAGLFDEDEGFQTMFESSVRVINKERHENEELSNVFLGPEAIQVETDLFEISLKVCELVKTGIVGIFGPQKKVTAEYVQSICDTMEVPHISVRQDSSESFQSRGLSLNFYPHVSSLSQIYYQLVIDLKWKNFAILYENTDSLIRMRLLLKRSDPHGNSAFMYHLGDGPNYRQAMQEIKTSDIENIIIDCSSDILNDVLKQAQQVGILSEKHKVIVTSLDLQTLDLEPYQYSGVNFTGLRLIDPEDPIVSQTFNKHKNEWGLDDPSQLQVEPALMYDAVQLFARAFKQLKDAIKGDVKELPCDGSVRWEHGLSLSNFMRSTETQGLTGLVKFDRDGFRSNIQLDIVHLTENGLKKIGVWNSTNGKNIDWLPDTKKSDVELNLQNRTFIVLISLTAPYGYEKESWTTLTGNDRYEGFAVDLIDSISQISKFNYTLQVEKDYGSYNNRTKKWSGMLGKIINDEADFAITDLTITEERQKAVDFTNPFMNLGISILYRKAGKQSPSLFSFLSPFSNEVWSYLIGVYIIVSLLFFVMGRLCPAEWNNPYPCIEEPEELDNQFTFKNAFWFAIGAIMQQGSEIAPIGISTRMMASLWWFFCLIMVSSYTANLAAFLTVETPVQAFDNVEELAKQKHIKYGAKDGGATLKFFEHSDHSTYKDMFEFMKANKDDVLPKENDIGVNKVKTENYAFLMESSSIEYITERECKVAKVGGLLDEKGYGIAMKKDSPHRPKFNAALLKLSESGGIADLQKKWWKEKRGGGKCKDDGGSNSAEELGVAHVGGVFLVLTVGVALSCIYTIFELLWDVAQTSIQENVPFKEELINELKFIIKFSGSKSTRRRNGASSKSEENSTRGCTPPYGFIPTVITTSPTDDK
ncbi:glutamate receptor ionotropic, kainate 2-like isoform X2 [Cataglyphis hispanica]|uniref:glutamate receptor ionotropic, kainate 2-like isoform X2 n=1 Tax=Cataglyphis hispanica TaxID=1086592 RepID=UPI00217F5860|nr:glutamate receptor ionotropic, kainate 2-like isoform X2 [Cataglyphis hispanica]